MNPKIEAVFEELKEALKGKDPREYESEYMMRAQAAASRAGDILLEVMPSDIKSLAENDQKRITWALEAATEMQNKMEEVVNYLEDYYNQNSK